MRLFVSTLTILLTVTAAAPQLHAQVSHAVPPSTLEAAIQQHIDATSADREAVRRVLAHSDVREVAARAGIDLRRATSAVSRLEGDELARAAAQARHIEDALAGGQYRSRATAWFFYLLGLAIVPLVLVLVWVS